MIEHNKGILTLSLQKLFLFFSLKTLVFLLSASKEKSAILKIPICVSIVTVNSYVCTNCWTTASYSWLIAIFITRLVSTDREISSDRYRTMSCSAPGEVIRWSDCQVALFGNWILTAVIKAAYYRVYSSLRVNISFIRSL